MLLYRKTAYFGGEISPDGATENWQGWSAADPRTGTLSNIKPQGGDGRQIDVRRPFGTLLYFVVLCRGCASLHPCLCSAAPSGLG